MNWQSVVCLAAVFLTAQTSRADQPLGPATVVIYNKNAPDSTDLAKFYAQQRGIPRDHLVGLDCPFDEEISRDDYDATIAIPLRDVFEKRHWWTIHGSADKKSVTGTTIRFAAVMKGVPLKVRPTATPYPGDEPGPGPINSRNEASVDSELSVLGYFSPRISGVISNPYFQSFRAIGEFENPALLLVCRLDAPTSATVRRMITDGIAAEKNGLWGRGYVDSAQNTAPGFEIGDKWMSNIRDELRKEGVPVVFEDTPAVFPDGYPMNDCALYYGWYAGGISGPSHKSIFGLFRAQSPSTSIRIARRPCVILALIGLGRFSRAEQRRAWGMFTSLISNSPIISTLLTIASCTDLHLPRALTCRFSVCLG
jgi:uncharacterized protein (TIGR03790 family)